MVEETAPVRRRRLGAHGMMFRRRRIFARLREGFTYEEIAAEEGVSPSRIRQIVSQELQQCAVDSGAEHAAAGRLRRDTKTQPPACFFRTSASKRRE